jgi:small multidrug resistance family-3 protein
LQKKSDFGGTKLQEFLNQVVANPLGAFFVLAFAAFLEVLGDSYFQTGLHRSSAAARVASFIAGGLLLALYGLVVNFPPWDFGKLLGVYVVLVFVVAQVVAGIRFHESPSTPIMLGGALILAGGMVIVFWKA